MSMTTSPTTSTRRPIDRAADDPVVDPRRHQRLLRPRLQHPGQRPDADRPADLSWCRSRPRDVLGTVLPALGIALLVGNVYYTFLARRLARRENRTDVTAMPYGPSVPHMFIVVFVIMLPIYLTTKDPMQAWAGRAGLGVHHRRDRADRRVRRARTSASSPRGRRCSARWPASRSPSSRCGRPRRCGRRPWIGAAGARRSSWSASSPT